MENDPLQNDKTTQSVGNADTQASNVVSSESFNEPNGANPSPQVFGAQPKHSRKLRIMKIVLQCLLVIQVGLGILTICILYVTRNARDLSGIEAFVTIVLHVLLLSVSIVLFGFYAQACRRNQIKRSVATTVLLAVSLLLIVLSSVAGQVITSDPPYGGYETAVCNDQRCMSQHFSQCKLVAYTATATINSGLPDEAIATTRYTIYSTTEKYGCRMQIETQTKTPIKTLDDGSKSQRTLKNQTLFCQAYPGMDFEQYIQEVLDDPSQHECI